MSIRTLAKEIVETAVNAKSGGNKIAPALLGFKKPKQKLHRDPEFSEDEHFTKDRALDPLEKLRIDPRPESQCAFVAHRRSRCGFTPELQALVRQSPEVQRALGPVLDKLSVADLRLRELHQTREALGLNARADFRKQVAQAALAAQSGDRVAPVQSWAAFSEAIIERRRALQHDALKTFSSIWPLIQPAIEGAVVACSRLATELLDAEKKRASLLGQTPDDSDAPEPVLAIIEAREQFRSMAQFNPHSALRPPTTLEGFCNLISFNK